MSTQQNATISPDRPAGGPHLVPYTVSSSSRAKRRQEEADTHDGTRPSAKVARLATAEEETKAQKGDKTPETPLTTVNIMDLLKGLWSDDTRAIETALTEIGNLCSSINYSGRKDSSEENELKIRVLGGHTSVFQVLQKHIGCQGIQELGIRALVNFSRFTLAQKLLGAIGCVELILARMNKYQDSAIVQLVGCSAIGNLVRGRMKGNAERVEKSGGIVVVVAAMKAHPNIELLQRCGCRALANMSEWEEYTPLIVEAGGASVIASVMEKYRDKPELLELAYNAMEKLVKKPRASLAVIS
jgi:hypothetical protein